MNAIDSINKTLEALSSRIDLLLRYQRNMITRRTLTSIRVMLEEDLNSLRNEVNELRERIKRLEDLV